MNPVFMFILIVVGVAIFCRTMYFKIQLLLALQPVNRFDFILERIKSVLLFAFGQKRLVGRKRERTSGIMHAIIFWGFCVLLIRSIHLYGEGFVEGFHLPFLGGEYLVGFVYLGIKDLMEGLVLLMVIYAIFRRAVLKPKRLHNTWEAYLILGLIGILMISDLLYDASRYNLVTHYNNAANIHFISNPSYGSEFAWSPIAVTAAALISGMKADGLTTTMTLMFWLHIITQLTFLNLLPLGKHFHVITSLPNVFFKSIGYPHEKPQVLDLENETAWEEESLGLNHIHQLNWKQGLDLYTCTECGRCKDVCPTYTTDKPLNLYDFNMSLKNELLANSDRIIQRAKLAGQITADTDPEQATQIRESLTEFHSEQQLVGDVIAPDTLWACTTCRACEEVCPVTIEHVPRIVAMRQGQMTMMETYPKELNPALKGLERNGNPWGIGYDKRADWAQGLDVKTMAEDPDVDYLFWVGCAGSFDDRAKKVSVSMVNILQKAGIRFAILGTEEKCTGDFARKVGNEMLYQMMAQENIDTLNQYKVQRIVTACPHCLNTLKHEYPQMGGHYEVIHHSQLIQQLISQGKIRVKPSFAGALTYHDPCYLGRYNGVYDAPRGVLNALSDKPVNELYRHGSESFCCGAGGGRMWMEEKIGKRINLERAEEIVALQASHVAVGCPFCLTMIEDGMKELGKEETITTLDIAELVAKHMED